MRPDVDGGERGSTLGAYELLLTFVDEAVIIAPIYPEVRNERRRLLYIPKPLVKSLVGFGRARPYSTAFRAGLTRRTINEMM